MRAWRVGVVVALVVLVLDPHFQGVQALQKRKSYDDVEYFPPDLCDDQAVIAKRSVEKMFEALLHGNEMWKQAGRQMITEECVGEVQTAIDNSKKLQFPYISRDPDDPIHRIAALSHQLMHQRTRERLTAQNNQPTTLFPWIPEYKAAPDQTVIVMSAFVVMYGVVGIAYVVLAYKGVLSIAKEDKQEAGIVSTNLWVVYALMVGLAVIGIYNHFGRRRKVTFLPGRFTTLAREDVLAAIFTILLWAVVGSMLFHYAWDRVSVSTMVSFMLRVVALLGIASGVYALVLAVHFRTEEQWRESLTLFMLRHLQLTHEKLGAESEWWDQSVLREVWVAALPPSCLDEEDVERATLKRQRATEGQAQLSADDSVVCTDPIEFPFLNGRCDPQPPAAKPGEKEGEDTDEELVATVQSLQQELAALQGELHSSAGVASMSVTRRKLLWALRSAVEACAVSYLCEKTHTSAQAGLGKNLIDLTTNSLTMIVGAMGVTAVASAASGESNNSNNSDGSSSNATK